MKLTRLERWIIRRAYRFAPATRARATLTGERPLRELVADALDDLESNDLPTFRDRLDGIAELHGFLLRLTSVHDAEGRTRSLATELAANWFRSVADVWASTLVPLFERAAAKLPESLPAFEHVASLPLRIAAAAGPKAGPRELQDTDALLAYLAYRLFDRGAREAGIVTASGGVAEQPMPLPAGAADWYDEAWRTFYRRYMDLLEQRLRWLDEQAVAPNPATVWDLLVSGAPSLQQHLEQTARFVVKATVIGDTRGGGRVLDLLFGAPAAISLYLKTGSRVRLHDYPDGDMAPSRALLSEKNWTAVAGMMKRLQLDLGSPEAVKSVFQSALLNDFRDMCLALAVVLAEFARQAGQKSVAAVLLRKLCRGEFLDRDSILAANVHEFALVLPAPRTVLRTAAVVLASDPKRGELIEEYIRTMREIDRPLPVIGQVYVVASTSNRLQEASGEVALVLLALALDRTLSFLWLTEPTQIGLKAPSEADERVARFLDAVAKAVSEVEDDLLHALAPTRPDPPAIRKARQRVRVTCRLLARRLRRRHEQAERTAPLDPERLQAIATFAGSLAFDREKAGPPVSLFAQIEHDSKGDDDRETETSVTFTVTGYRRGELAKPLLKRPVDNEEEFWAETFRDVVAGGVLRRIYDRIPRRLRLASPEAWRDALIAWRSEIGPDEPLLFWGRDWPLSWSRDRGMGEAIATRLNTRDSSAEILARTPFLDGVRLVSLPTCGEPTLLAPASMFRRLIVSAPHGRPIAITTAEDPTDPTKVKLTLHARFTLDLDRPDRALILDVTDPA